MIALKKILVATDFSEPSDAALAYGRELARTFGASLTVLHVVDNILTRAYGADGVVLADPELQREIEASAQRRWTPRSSTKTARCWERSVSSSRRIPRRPPSSPTRATPRSISS